MANKKKKLTAAIAGVTAAALLLGGTFAWQSISQVALNEKEEIINPGGRLHDDFNGTNKDIYVENFADDPIFARVRLDEYFEITMNKGVTGAEKTEIVTEGATKEDTSTYVTHKFNDNDKTKKYWDWTTGGSTVYMPTFNKNKDSLQADINGTFKNEYEDYVDYSDFTGNDTDGNEATGVGAGKKANAIYDVDSNTVDEFLDDSAVLDTNYKQVEETHYVAETAEGSLISMEDWFDLVENGESTDNYWVYDEDGWVYWSSPIEAGTATGLLLDEIHLKEVMDDSYYYAINVVAQFITADDLGKEDGTGFYDTDAGTAPTKEALTLLEKIGVNLGNSDNDGDDNDNEEAIEVTSLTVTGMDEIYSVESNLGTMYIGANVRINEKDNPVNSKGELIDGFTLKVYEKDGTEPVCVKTGEQLLFDRGHDMVIADVTNDNLNLSHNGNTVFDVEFSYTKGESTITAEKVPYTFRSYVIELTEKGSSYTGMHTKDSGYIKLNGTFPNWADLKFSKDEKELYCTLNQSAKQAYYSVTKDGNSCLELNQLPDPIRFHAYEAGTYTISLTVDGTTYSATVTVTEAE